MGNTGINVSPAWGEYFQGSAGVLGDQELTSRRTSASKEGADPPGSFKTCKYHVPLEISEFVLRILPVKLGVRVL